LLSAGQVAALDDVIAKYALAAALVAVNRACRGKATDPLSRQHLAVAAWRGIEVGLVLRAAAADDDWPSVITACDEWLAIDQRRGLHVLTSRSKLIFVPRFVKQTS
jgi:hypothetical protein